MKRKQETKKLDGLPAAFTYLQARRAGLSKRHLYCLRDTGNIEIISRGLFRRSDSELIDVNLIEIAIRSPRAILCLETALARHGLSDAIPSKIDIAIPRGVRPHAIKAPVRWHRFEPYTFDLGRKWIKLKPGIQIGIYNPERCIVDAFRLRRLEGYELGREALRRWLRQRGARPAELMAMARSFPRTMRALSENLEILLGN